MFFSAGYAAAPLIFASAYPVTKTRLGFSIARLAAETDL